MTGTVVAPGRPTGGPQPVARFGRPLIQTLGFLRKEIVEVARQPRLLIVLVAAPFLVLALFAVGYDQEQVVLNTRFVGPPGSVYEGSLDEATSSLGRYLTSAGYGSDREAALDELRAGRVDLVVVFPDDPAGTVLGNEQAVVEVLHDKLDPIQQTAVDVAAQVAVAELNATVLERLVGETQQRLATAAQRSGDLADTGLSDDVATALLGDGEGDPAEEARVREAIETARAEGRTVLELEPGVVVRPFRSDASSVLPEPVTITDFFAPAAVALLIQHLVLTMIAMSLVADRSIGLFEVFQVGPIGAGRIIVGKYLAHVLVGATVTAALLVGVVAGLGVPAAGAWWWLAVGMFGLVSASIGLGIVVAMASRSAIQAVQYAMLVLLGGLFFGGFLLELDAFRYPVKALSWLLPVTYGVRLLRDVMLRGAAPRMTDLAGLASLTVLYGLAGWALLARRLRVS